MNDCATNPPDASDGDATPIRCRVFGHRYRFWADGPVMHWQCERECAAGATKTYASAAEATRFATVFDREEQSELGRNAPFLGLFPLRIWHRLSRRPRER